MLDREELGKIVREVWVAWAKQNPKLKDRLKPEYLVQFDDLDEDDKECNRLIGEAVANAILKENQE